MQDPRLSQHLYLVILTLLAVSVAMDSHLSYERYLALFLDHRPTRRRRLCTYLFIWVFLVGPLASTAVAFTGACTGLFQTKAAVAVLAVVILLTILGLPVHFCWNLFLVYKVLRRSHAIARVRGLILR